ncbi:glycosyltransferase family protein [Aeromonas salmonicida]|uniref:glycosyltransferase family protein n=1 Tax=Aeromonas salmonicida TaxID=645 RepID=UPI003D25FA6F
MEKIMILGAFNIEYIHDNCRSPFRDVLGCAAISINVLPLSFYLGKKDVEAYVLDVANKCGVKLIHIYHDWIKELFSEEFWHKLADGRVISAFYPDDEPGQWMDLNLEKFDHHYNFIFTHSKKAYQIRCEQGYDNISHLPWGYNNSLFRHEPGHHGHDIVFIGKNKQSNSSFTGAEDGKQRDMFLEICAAYAVSRNLDLAIYGYGWEEHQTLGAYARGVLDIADFNKVYSSAGVVFNPAWAPGSQESQVKLRHFEVLGAGAIQITNSNPELFEVLGESPAVIYFNSGEELQEKLSTILHNRSRDRQRQWFEINRSMHSIQNRVRTMLQKLHFPTNKVDKPFLDIDLKNLSTMSDILLRVQETFKCNPNVEFITINSVGDDTYKYVDEGFVATYCRNDKICQFGVMFDFSAFQTNHLHFSDNNGELSCEFIESYDAFERLLAEPASKHLDENNEALVTLDSESIFIDSLVFPRNANYSALMERISHRDVENYTSHFPIEYKVSKNTARFIKPMQMWRKIFDHLSLLSHIQSELSLCIYGVGGSFGKSLIRFFAKNFQNVRILAVDNRLAGKYMDGLYIHDKSVLCKYKIDAILIAAEASGPLIYEDMRNAEPVGKVIRAYDTTYILSDVIDFIECYK